MMDLTEILRNYQGKFKMKYAGRTTGQQLAAMKAVLDCRSARYGSMALDCSSCDFQSLAFHACGNRSCHQSDGRPAKITTQQPGSTGKPKNCCRLSILW